MTVNIYIEISFVTKFTLNWKERINSNTGENKHKGNKLRT